MKTDGYILTPELLQWRYFHRPVVVQVLDRCAEERRKRCE